MPKYAEFTFMAYELASVKLPEGFDEDDRDAWEDVTDEAYETIAQIYPQHDWGLARGLPPHIYEGK